MSNTRIQAYELKQQKIREKLTLIAELLEASQTDNPNWGHIGSLGHVDCELGDIVRMLGGSDEDEE